jgi:hypothetical protein
VTRQERLDALIQRALAELGGRADDEQILDVVVNSMPRPERDAVLRGYLKTRVSYALRQRQSDGLALSQKINGTWTQRALFTEEEYRFVVTQHSKLSGAHRKIALRYVAECFEKLGVDISDEMAVAS